MSSGRSGTISQCTVVWLRWRHSTCEKVHKCIEGRIQSRKYQGKDGIERTAYDIIANEMKMLGGRQDNSQGEVPAPPTAKPITSEQYRAASGGSTRRQPAPVTPASDIDGDIPY